MTLYAGPRPKNARLTGPERALDAVIGLIVLVAAVFIALLVLAALWSYGEACDANAQCASGDALQFGYLIVLAGGGLAMLVTAFVYIGRLVAARRSWGAPLTGIILFSIAAVIGWFVMSGLG